MSIIKGKNIIILVSRTGLIWHFFLANYEINEGSPDEEELFLLADERYLQISEQGKLTFISSISISFNSRLLRSRFIGALFLIGSSFGMRIHSLTLILAKESNSWLVLEAFTNKGYTLLKIL